MVTASLGGEISERVEKAIRLTNDFCTAYQATMTGSEDWQVSSEFGYDGQSTALAIIKKADILPISRRSHAPGTRYQRYRST